jgi:hypothetical protein
MCQRGGDDKARDDEEDINADKAAWQVGSVEMEKHDGANRDCPQAVDGRKMPKTPLRLRRLDNRPDLIHVGYPEIVREVCFARLQRSSQRHAGVDRASTSRPSVCAFEDQHQQPNVQHFVPRTN